MTPGNASGASVVVIDPSGEERRVVRGVAPELVPIERDAKPGYFRDFQMALGVELEGLFGNAVDIGAAADEFDEIDIGQGSGQLKVGCHAECGVPAMADVFDAHVVGEPGDPPLFAD